MKRFRFFLIACILSSFLLTGCSLPFFKNTQLAFTFGFARDEVAKIGAASVKTHEMQVAVADALSLYTERLGDEILNKQIDDISFADMIRNDCFARLVEIKTLCLMAKELDITLEEDEKNRALFAGESCYSALSEDERDALFLHDASDLTEMFCEKHLAGKVYDFLIKDVNPEVSDDEARTVTASRIVISKSAHADGGQLAADIRNRILSGERFETLLSTYNEADTATVLLRIGESDKALTDAAFLLNTGEVSPVIETADQYVLLKCISTFDREETAANKERILALRRKEAFESAYDPYAASLPRKLNEALYDAILPEDAYVPVYVRFGETYDQYFLKED